MSSAQGYSIHICELHICSFKQPKSKSIPQTLHLAWRGDTYTCLSSTEQLTTVKRITSLQAILNYIETLSQKQNEMKNNKRWGETLHCYQKKYSSFLLFPKQYRISTLQLAVERWFWSTQEDVHTYMQTLSFSIRDSDIDGFWCSWGVVKPVQCILRDDSMRKDSLIKGHLDTTLNKKEGAGRADISKNRFKQREKNDLGLTGSLWLLYWY